MTSLMISYDLIYKLISYEVDRTNFHNSRERKQIMCKQIGFVEHDRNTFSQINEIYSVSSFEQVLVLLLLAVPFIFFL